MNKIDYLIIAYLERNKTSTMKELSHNLSVDKSTISKSIKRLKSLKMIKEIKKYPREVFLA